MFGLIKKLLGSGATAESVLEGWWCDAPIKLPSTVQTPAGSKVTVLRVCIDLFYTTDGSTIEVRRARLSRAGGELGSVSVNVAADRTGEVWSASSVCPEAMLADAVHSELHCEGSRLRKAILRKWNNENRPKASGSLAEALNSQMSPGDLQRVIAAADRGNEVSFTYTKAKGQAETRRVTVLGVSGQSIRARDHKDGESKLFRIDRISDAKMC